jgi:hypothetical protein
MLPRFLGGTRPSPCHPCTDYYLNYIVFQTVFQVVGRFGAGRLCDRLLLIISISAVKHFARIKLDFLPSGSIMNCVTYLALRGETVLD